MRPVVDRIAATAGIATMLGLVALGYYSDETLSYTPAPGVTPAAIDLELRQFETRRGWCRHWAPTQPEAEECIARAEKVFRTIVEENSQIVAPE